MRRKLSEGRSLARMMWQTKSLWMLPCLVVAAWLAVAVVVRGPLFPPRGGEGGVGGVAVGAGGGCGGAADAVGGVWAAAAAVGDHGLDTLKDLEQQRRVLQRQRGEVSRQVRNEDAVCYQWVCCIRGM